MGKNEEGDPAQGAGHSSNILLYIIAAFLALGVIYRASLPLILKIQDFAAHHRWQVRVSEKAALAVVILIFAAWLRNRYLEWLERRSITSADGDSVLLGEDLETKKKVYLKPAFRTMHTQLIGTTNAGKTASVILPWAVNDIEQGRGCIIVDGKSDRGFLDKLYSHVVQAGRQSDFMVFSLANPYISSTFNPFCQGTPEQITERVFSAFKFEEEYYKSIQFTALRTIIALLMRRGEAPMPGVIRECLSDRKKIEGWLEGVNDPNLAQDVLRIMKGNDEELEKRYSGICTALANFSQGSTAALFNTRHPEIILSNILKQQKICYFQLPTMQFQFLGEATGKLLLQSLQSAISELQVGGDRLKTLFSVYLDDFNDYIYPGFSSLLNKSRSANVGVVFAHQALGDLSKVSPDFKQIVMTNTNVKIIMRSNDPESAEQFAKVIGTITAEKTTERRRKLFWWKQDTGDQSVREVEQYRFHPNVFKDEQGLGEGVVIIPHARGRVVKRIQFSTVDDLPALRMPMRDLPVVDLVAAATNPGAGASNKPKAPQRKGKKEKQEPEQTLATDQPEVKTLKKRKKAAIAAPVTTALLLFSLGSGCATTGRSIGAGAAAGGITGAGIGALADPGRHGEMRFRNVVIGTAVGAAVGAGAGFAMDRFTHDEREDAAKQAKTDAAREAEAHAAASTGMEPRLLPARTEARWVPDQVRGSTFIPGHFEYIIVESARWETGK